MEQIKIQRSKLPYILALLVGALVSCIGFFWLWHEYLLFAVFTSVLLMSGAALLPEKSPWAHAASLGICIGAFLGCALGFLLLQK